MSEIANNPWRNLARSLGLQCTGDVVRIPDLSDQLLDPKRFEWDRNQFDGWFKQYYAKRQVDPRSVYPEWRFNHQVGTDGSGFSTVGRNSFLCVYAKLKHEQLWSEVKTIHWVGVTGEVTFIPKKGSEGLRKYLLTRGYGDWWLASNGCAWGVRSRYRGAQLHFRGFKDPYDPINVHIDLNNPGDRPGAPPTGWLEELPQAIKHSLEDDRNRSKTHTWQQLRQALEAQGIKIPSSI